jgi:hypothetical protein
VVTVAELRRENETLRAQLDRLIATNSALAADVAKLNERVSELLAVARRRQRPPAAAPPPAPSPPLDAPAARAFADRPVPPPVPEKPKPTTKPRRPTGRKPLPAHLEAESHELRPDSCAHCGGRALDAADVVVEEKLHVVKEHQRRRVVRRYDSRSASRDDTRTSGHSVEQRDGRDERIDRRTAALANHRIVEASPPSPSSKDVAS